MPTPARMFVWAEASQEALISATARQASVEVRAVGSPNPTSSARLSHALGVDRVDDLRAAVLRDDIDLVWLASPHRLSADEARLLPEVAPEVISTVPRPASIAALIEKPEAGDATTFVPLMRRTGSFRRVLEALDAFGPAHALSISLRCRGEEGTLFGRLFDAMDLVQTICGEVQTLTASLAGPLPVVPEAVDDLHGHLTINMRFAENRAACAMVSDAGGSWFRGLCLIGEGGCVRASDGRFHWSAPDGQVVDQHEEVQEPTAASLIAEEARRRIDPRSPRQPPPRTLELLALCEAVRLSGRTGQPETPGKLRQMLSRV